jgi:hypothetical protein
LAPRYLNVTKCGISRRIVDEAFLGKVRDFHAADMQMYRRALQWRQARLRPDHEQNQKILIQKTNDLAAIAFREKLSAE